MVSGVVLSFGLAFVLCICAFIFSIVYKTKNRRGKTIRPFRTAGTLGTIIAAAVFCLVVVWFAYYDDDV